jgi:acyl carrier protein
MEAIRRHLMTVLTEKFEAPADRIRPDATLDDLGLDSLAVVELYLTLQEHWHIPLEDDTATNKLTVDDVARAVADQLGTTPA